MRKKEGTFHTNCSSCADGTKQNPMWEYKNLGGVALY